MDSETVPTPENITLFQGFEWNIPGDSQHLSRLINELPKLKSIGIDNVWLPPACKASAADGNGYDIYDLYDLGEFEQKGGTATKWGTREDLNQLAIKAKELDMGLYWDAVLNHKAGADKKERCVAIEVDKNDHTKEISEPHEIEAWLGFEFPGRADRYSSLKYHWYHFNGTDFNAETGKKAIYKICGEDKGWSSSVSNETGNADFLMFANLSYSHPEVVDDVKNWGVWIAKELKLKGFRLDAVQHFSERFTNEWIKNLKEAGGEIFFVGEYWTPDPKEMKAWLDNLDHEFSLYDAPLVYNFSNISKSNAADLRKVFENSFLQIEPSKAVTVVMNHDTQPGQTVETPIEGFFKPLAYALILLRQEGYPCPFYGDLYGMNGSKDTGAPQEPPSCGNKLADIILARKLYAYGDQVDYWDEPNCIGWVRRGTWDKPAGCAVIMSNTGPAKKRMCVGNMHNGEDWTDVLGWQSGKVTIDDEGFGIFPCPEMSVAIWVKHDAHGRDRYPVHFNVQICEQDA